MGFIAISAYGAAAAIGAMGIALLFVAARLPGQLRSALESSRD